MKKTKNIIKAFGASVGLLLMTACLFASCSSDEDFYYQDDARVRLVGDYLWAAGTDSISFSFVSFGEDVTQQEMTVDAQIMGDVQNRDRVVNLVVDAAKTTADANIYSFPNTVTIPSGKDKATFTVVLKRVASLQMKEARLCIKVAESADVKVGVNEENHITMIWNDILSSVLTVTQNIV